jgi:hypothetical protein
MAHAAIVLRMISLTSFRRPSLDVRMQHNGPRDSTPHVHFTPKTDMDRCDRKCPLCANRVVTC